MSKRTKSRKPFSSVSEPSAQLQELEAAKAQHAEAERAVEESEALYRAVVESLTDGIAITVGTTRAFVNKAFLDIHGLKDASQVVGLPVDQFVLPEYSQKVKERLLAREHGDPVETIAEYKIRRLDGEVRTIQASTGTISFRGEVAGLAVLRDITEQKRAEEEIRKLNEVLERKISELNKSNHDLEAFNYSVSHDLRIPLMAIDGFSRRLLQHYADGLDPKGLQMLNLIRSDVHKMDQLIDDLLAYARLGRQEMGLSTVSIEQVARAVLEELAAIYSERKIELQMGKLPPAYCDESMIRQVFANLLSNAFKFTKYRDIARIEIGGSAGASENLYWVKDNGVGFDQQDAEKLFGVFQRLYGSDQFEGTGIGLAIVKRIIDFHKGRVWAEGKPDSGATFYFTLPADEHNPTK
ncbi:MAG TPA: ATP-binding protein [Syntrophorhabdales bacterium]|nr:ATP-binding protein [Syntrophorhabdales bacterium]